MFDNDFLALLPEIFLINATIVLLIYGAIFSTSKKYNYPPLVRNVAWLGLFSIVVTIILVATSKQFCSLTTANLCYNTLIIDDFTYFCKIALLLSTASTILMSLQYFKQETVNTFESIVLILLSTCSMLFMISAYDLIAIYLAIELQSLCFYVIAASKRTSEFSTEAGLKYFILGAFSSGILLFGCSLIYGFTGVTNLEELSKIFTGYEIAFGTETQGHFLGLTNPAGVFTGILFLAVGFLFKITAVPFHMWAPDVYEGSPTFVTAFFSIAPKIAILANMLRVFIFSVYDPTWQQLFVFSSIASMTLGAIAGLAQNKVKRLLAYSSIAHVGYMLIGFSCGTIEGIQSLLIAIFIYVLMTINAFAIVLALRQNRLKYISDLGALARTNPILAMTFAITMFSYAGIPPLAGFCSKFYLFFAALGCGAYLLALVGIITSVISCFYYIRFVKVMYFDTPSTWILYKTMDREKSLLLGITLFGIIFFFLYPSPIFLVTHQMALSLCF
jgi:proton-translocating NADH-quinone oxidoreductase chain N